MADFLTTVTELLNKPEAAFGGRLVAGAALAGIVWKFFERVEAVLTDRTKFEIAVWLVGVKPFGPKMEPWADTFAKLVSRVFGNALLSWRALSRSCIASSTSYLVCLALSFPKSFLDFDDFSTNMIELVWLAFLPDFCCLLKTRLLIRVIQCYDNLFIVTALIIFDLLLGIVMLYTLSAVLFWPIMFWLGHGFQIPKDMPPGSFVTVGMSIPSPNLVASLFTSIWLWLYAYKRRSNNRPQNAA